MKKLFILIAGTAMIFTSCKKYEVAEEVDLESLPTVTIKGTVYAELNETNGTLEYAPEGKKVRVTVAYSEYGLNAASGNLIRETEIQQNGAYSVTIPVISKGVSATLAFEEFDYQVMQMNANGETELVWKRFTYNRQTIGGLGSTKVIDVRVDVQYSSLSTEPNDGKLQRPSTSVELSGKLEYVKDDSTTSSGIPISLMDGLWASVPAGTKVYAEITLTDADGRIYKEQVTVTVAAGGEYKVNVPMTERGSATVRLTGEGFWQLKVVATPDNKNEFWRYELDESFTVFNTNTPDKNAKYKAKTKINDL